MKILVTGGAGLIGKSTTERLVQDGFDVRVIGLEAEADLPGAEFVTCDIMNFDDLREQVRGCDAVIHLAAIRSPQLAPAQKLFEVNVAGTFNVFEAAAAEGIKRVVQASSINAIGCAYNLLDIAPQYLPIDEDHPVYTTDPYSYSKEAIEDIGRYFWRRDGISSVALRFPAVFARTQMTSDRFRDYRKKAVTLLDELGPLDEAERQTRIATVREAVLEWRTQRPMEFRDGVPEPLPRASPEDLLFYAYAIDRFNFWAWIDERDAAQSLEKGVTAEYEGAHPLFINAQQNWLGYYSASLARVFFPEISPENIKLPGSATLVSIDRARTLIGFEPEHAVEP